MNKRLNLSTNGGTHISNQVVTIKNLGEVWYNPSSLANVISLVDVRKICRMTMDNDIEPDIIVHRKDGTTMKFKEFKSGLYFHDTEPNIDSYGYCLLQAVTENKMQSSRR